MVNKEGKRIGLVVSEIKTKNLLPFKTKNLLSLLTVITSISKIISSILDLALKPIMKTVWNPTLNYSYHQLLLWTKSKVEAWNRLVGVKRFCVRFMILSALKTADNAADGKISCYTVVDLVYRKKRRVVGRSSFKCMRCSSRGGRKGRVRPVEKELAELAPKSKNNE